MNRFFYRSVLLFMGVLMLSCRNGNDEADAYGNFEADEVIVSAQAQGEMMFFEIEEGETLNEGQLVGVIDTTSVVLQKNQLEAQKK
ncbi:MAG: hypothetical protein HC906_02450 [Bacteroidales bacterium]|nr:hypothetical protein [Bacteroidales bacterium]